MNFAWIWTCLRLYLLRVTLECQTCFTVPGECSRQLDDFAYTLRISSLTDYFEISTVVSQLKMFFYSVWNFACNCPQVLLQWYLLINVTRRVVTCYDVTWCFLHHMLWRHSPHHVLWCHSPHHVLWCHMALPPCITCYHHCSNYREWKRL